MQRALFIISPERSRYNAAIAVARLLRNYDIETTFFGAPEFGPYVKERGFHQIDCLTLQDPKEIPRLIGSFRLLEARKICDQVLTEIGTRLDQEDFGITIVTSTLQIAAVPALERSLPVVFFWSQLMDLRIAPHLPSCTSMASPPRSTSERIRLAKHWLKRYIQNRPPQFFLSEIIGPHRIMRRRLRKIGIHPSFGFGFPCIPGPRLIAVPRVFEWNEITSSLGDDVYFAGLSYEPAVESSGDIPPIGGRKLIVFSLGTIYKDQGKGNRILAELIKVLAARDDLFLMASLGEYGNGINFGVLPPNVYLAKWLPQDQLLSYASLMITHGGMSTVRECIFHRCPMLVIPLFYDQPGNAARVKEKRLGRILSASRVSRERLDLEINEILRDNLYANSIDAFARKCSGDDLSPLWNSILTRPAGRATPTS